MKRRGYYWTADLEMFNRFTSYLYQVLTSSDTRAAAIGEKVIKMTVMRDMKNIDTSKLSF